MEPPATVEDLNAKMELVQSIVQKCVAESKMPSPSDAKRPRNKLALLKYYTQVSTQAARRFTNPEIKAKSLDLWLSEPKDKLVCLDEERLEELKQYIYELYTKMNVIPIKSTIAAFVKASQINLDKANRYLKQEHFAWVPLAKAKEKCVLVEQFEHAAKRYCYLERIMKYRKDGSTIIYIDDKFLNKHIQMISDGDRLFDVSFNDLRVAVGGCIELFVMNKLPLLPVGSVLVIGERMGHPLAMPEENSKKSEMIDWLEKRNIQHDVQMHRAELYELIQRSKVDYEPTTYALDEVMRARGFSVLRRPLGMDQFSFFYKFLSEYDKALKREKATALKEFQTQYTSKDWMDMNKALIELEKVTYERDMLMETITDQLMTFDWHGSSQMDMRQSLKHLDNYVLDPDVLMKDYVL